MTAVWSTAAASSAIENGKDLPNTDDVRSSCRGDFLLTSLVIELEAQRMRQLSAWCR
jgi:hypothetical protein